MKCKNCQKTVTGDGHGELIHKETGLYGCSFDTPWANEYPVAT